MTTPTILRFLEDDFRSILILEDDARPRGFVWRQQYAALLRRGMGASTRRIIGSDWPPQPVVSYGFINTHTNQQQSPLSLSLAPSLSPFSSLFLSPPASVIGSTYVPISYTRYLGILSSRGVCYLTLVCGYLPERSIHFQPLQKLDRPQRILKPFLQICCYDRRLYIAHTQRR